MSAKAIHRIVVLGGGTMGAQIVLRLAAGGYSVTVIDPDQARLTSARQKFEIWIRSDVPDPPGQQAALARITALCGSLKDDGPVRAALREADIVFETLPENVALKTDVFGFLDQVCDPVAILATVSSSQPVSRLISEVARRERVCNVHFFMLYPIRIQAAEVAGCKDTAPATLATARQLLESLEIIPFDVKEESLGFIFNFIWYQIKAAMLALVDRGVTDAQTADRLFRIVLGTQHGPFSLMQLVGLSTIRDIARLYAEEGGAGAFPVPALLDRMIADGGVFYNNPAVAQQPGWLETGTENGAESAPFLTPASFAGVWNLVSMTLHESNGDLIGPVLGDGATGTLIYTARGDMSVHLQHGQLPNIATLDPLQFSDAEAAAAFRATVAYSGKYRIDGQRLIHEVRCSTVPPMVGSDRVREWRFDAENRLELSTPPGQFGGTGRVIKLLWKLDHRI